jgi:hypothetical protein
MLEAMDRQIAEPGQDAQADERDPEGLGRKIVRRTPADRPAFLLDSIQNRATPDARPRSSIWPGDADPSTRLVSSASM